jgi:sarcosine oxidase, subunit gamma
MPEAVSALNGRTATGQISLRDLGPRGMITLRGDLGDRTLQQACTDLTGVGFPGPGTVQIVGDKGLGWMSPDEVLVMVPHDGVAAALARLTGALSGQHHLAVDVSDARAVIEVQGPAAREILAKLTPVNMHPAAFPVGQFRRSRLGQIAAAFWMQDDQTIVVICFRSVADYAFALLAQSIQDGTVGYFETP